MVDGYILTASMSAASILAAMAIGVEAEHETTLEQTRSFWPEPSRFVAALPRP